MTRRLAAALTALLPTREQTLLLRACLLGDEAAAAWAALQRRLAAGGVDDLLRANRRLLPLLDRAAARDPDGFRLPAALQRRLAAVTLREKERSAAFWRGASETLGMGAAAGQEVLVLRGAALAALAYPAPHLRHCHDLDLLVRGAGPLEDAAAGRASVHRSAFGHAPAKGDDGAFWDRAERVHVGGEAVRVMAPADMLVHVCGHAYFSPRRETLSWVADAWFTLAAWPALDWECVVGTAETRRLGVALHLTLGYLGRALDAPVPVPTLAQLRGLEVPDEDRDVALSLAWQAARRRAPSRARAVLSAGAGAPSLVRWRLLASSR